MGKVRLRRPEGGLAAVQQVLRPAERAQERAPVLGQAQGWGCSAGLQLLQALAPEVVAQAQGWGLPREWVRASGWAWEREC